MFLEMVVNVHSMFQRNITTGFLFLDKQYCDILYNNATPVGDKPPEAEALGKGIAPLLWRSRRSLITNPTHRGESEGNGWRVGAKFCSWTPYIAPWWLVCVLREIYSIILMVPLPLQYNVTAVGFRL